MIVRSCIPVTIDAAGFVILNTVDFVTIDAAGGGVKDLEHLDVPCAEALIGTTDREHRAAIGDSDACFSPLLSFRRYAP